jgi:Zn-dependent metalloprotease
MKHFRKASVKQFVFRLLSMAGVVVLFFSMGWQSVAAQGLSQLPQPEGNTLLAQCFNADQARSNYNSLNGNMNFLGATPGNAIRQLTAPSASASSEQAARGYLSDCGSLFGLTDQAAELTLMQQKPASSNRSVLKFQQVYQGIPVFAAVLIVQLDQSKNILMVGGNIAPKAQVDTQASIDAGTAQQKALLTVAGKYSSSSAALKATKPELWIYDPTLTQSEAGSSALVWLMDVTPVGLGPIRELVMVDAHTGNVVLNFNQVDTARNRLTYNLAGATSGSGTLVCNESNPTCSGGDTDAVNAHVYGGDTYNFYAGHFGRDSLDNAGMALYSYVHYDVEYCNAFWDGYEMVYGDGCFIVVDDVVAHEMTHGVTSHESNLTYQNQSGAINESLSDIFGEFVDLSNGKGNDSATVRWLMGEDTSIGAIRDMKTPPNHSQPDRMGSPLYYHGTSDNGGVHTNSGVGNKAAYLMTDGGAFNGYTITGLGITKTAAIFYEAQTNILIPSSTYSFLGNALNQACAHLTGTGGITAADCAQVNKAVLATEMITAASPIPTPQAPAGATTDTTPTYKWTKVAGATQYRYQLMRGAATVYTKTVAASVCAAVCTNTPTTVLARTAYKWHVQALVGGAWKTYSAFKAFTVSAPVAGFNSQFTSNATGWAPLNGAWSVAGGYYKSPGIAGKNVSSAHTGNYATLTYTVRMKRTGCVGCANVIYFRGTPKPVTSGGDWYKGLRLTVSNNGWFHVGYMWNGVFTFLVPWTKSSAVTGGLNTLKVTMSGAYVQCYVNGTRVAYGTITGFSSTGQVGVDYYRDSSAGTLYVDYATLTTSAPASSAATEGINLDTLGPINQATVGDPNIAP